MTEKPEDSSALQPADKGSAGLVRLMDRRVVIARRLLSEISFWIGAVTAAGIGLVIKYFVITP